MYSGDLPFSWYWRQSPKFFEKGPKIARKVVFLKVFEDLLPNFWLKNPHTGVFAELTFGSSCQPPAPNPWTPTPTPGVQLAPFFEPASFSAGRKKQMDLR